MISLRGRHSEIRPMGVVNAGTAVLLGTERS